MTPQEFNALHIVHVAAVVFLVGMTFYAFAGAPETKKRTAILAGMASMLVFLTGLRMWQAQLNFVIAGWIVVKMVCWLAISAFTGIAYRRRDFAGWLGVTTLVLAAIAIAMAYVKPF